MKRIVQRTPDLGLRIRMARPATDCCEPKIGAARWFNHATGAYDLTTVQVSRSGSNAYPYPVTTVQPLGHAAIVTGQLCACTVTWAVSMTLATTAPPEPPLVLPGLTDFVEILCPDRALVVVAKPELLLYDESGHIHFDLSALRAGGVVTVTPTVDCGDRSMTLGPIYLVLLSTAGGGCC